MYKKFLQILNIKENEHLTLSDDEVSYMYWYVNNMLNNNYIALSYAINFNHLNLQFR